MITSPRPPKRLRSLQHWFGSIISRPIDRENAMCPTSPNGIPMAIEAARYIVPSPTLQSEERIEIYNQQYWWRLLNVLQESFPFLVRLFGYQGFNEQIGFPYIQRYPSNHWSLNELGEKLPLWIKRYYNAADKDLVYNAAAIDEAFNRGFVAREYPPMMAKEDASDENFLSLQLKVQPHVTLFSLKWDLFDFRDTLLQNSVEYWLEEPFPEMKSGKELSFIVWRDLYKNMGWAPLHPLEYQLLKKFQKGCSFTNICDWIERQPAHIYNSTTDLLQGWTHLWTVNGWLYRVELESEGFAQS